MTSVPLPHITLTGRAAAKRLAAATGTLALIGFDRERSAGDGGSAWIETGLEALGPAPVQAFRVATPVEYGRAGRFTTRRTPGLAMLATDFPDAENPEEAAANLYRDLIEASRALGCPHLVRIWQYLPRITETAGGEERYRAYCAGRARAFTEAQADEKTLPAACLLGDAGERILLYALASATPGRQIENPRQQSAFRYPARYGRKSPSFSRATALGSNGREMLFVSGTSSITGHASRHSETLDQLDETLANLEALVSRWGGSAGGLGAIAPMKVYIRHPRDLEAVRFAVARRLPRDQPIVCLRADVCRAELNVEIEGIVQPSPESRVPSPESRVPSPGLEWSRAGVVQW